jgi:SM-20-related protein
VIDPSAAADIADALARTGVAIRAGFLAPDLVLELASESRTAFSAGRFHAARVGMGETRVLRPDVRGDHILWLDTPDSDVRRAYLAQMEALRLALNERLFLGLLDYECHFALYPPGGFYQRHVDRFRGDPRRAVSAVLYLNETWESVWGGNLRLFESERADSPYRDVAPQGGTLVCFLSNSVAHEVLPTTHERLSLTGWFRRRI